MFRNALLIHHIKIFSITEIHGNIFPSCRNEPSDLMIKRYLKKASNSSKPSQWLYSKNQAHLCHSTILVSVCVYVCVCVCVCVFVFVCVCVFWIIQQAVLECEMSLRSTFAFALRSEAHKEPSELNPSAVTGLLWTLSWVTQDPHCGRSYCPSLDVPVWNLIYECSQVIYYRAYLPWFDWGIHLTCHLWWKWNSSQWGREGAEREHEFFVLLSEIAGLTGRVTLTL